MGRKCALLRQKEATEGSSPLSEFLISGLTSVPVFVSLLKSTGRRNLTLLLSLLFTQGLALGGLRHAASEERVEEMVGDGGCAHSLGDRRSLRMRDEEGRKEGCRG